MILHLTPTRRTRGFHRALCQGERGMALVVAMLVLFILTVLGLALMLTASTEADVSANYRWSEMAFYNAEAGLENAKNVLAEYALSPDGDFRRALPAPRTTTDEMKAEPQQPAPCDRADPGCRDYQFSLAEGDAMVYIGSVLRDRSGRLYQYDFRAPTDTRSLPPGGLDFDNTQDVQGSVTIWVRRPIRNGLDDTSNARAVITAEGTAPNFDSPLTGRYGAIRRLEMTVALGNVTAGAGSPRNPYKHRANITDGVDVANPTEQRTIQ